MLLLDQLQDLGVVVAHPQQALALAEGALGVLLGLVAEEKFGVLCFRKGDDGRKEGLCVLLEVRRVLQAPEVADGAKRRPEVGAKESVISHHEPTYCHPFYAQSNDTHSVCCPGLWCSIVVVQDGLQKPMLCRT